MSGCRTKGKDGLTAADHWFGPCRTEEGRLIETHKAKLN